MKKFITAALFAITLAFSPAVMAQGECWTAGDFALQAAEYGDPLIVQIEDDNIVPLALAVNSALEAVGDKGVTVEWVKSIFYTYTIYTSRQGPIPAVVIGMFAENGCMLRIILAPTDLLHEVLKDPTKGST